MAYVTATYFQNAPAAMLHIQAPAYWRLPLQYKQQLVQLLQPHLLPGVALPAQVDPNGGPVSLLINWHAASLVCIPAERIVQKGLHNP